MHEMSLCEGVLQLMQEHAQSKGFIRVISVWLEVGELAQVEIEALEFCFGAVMRNTLADDAKLHIIRVPGIAWCMQCSQSVPLKQRYEPCPRCGGYQLQMTGGDELKVKELEVT